MWCKFARGIKAKMHKTNGCQKKGLLVITKYRKTNWIIHDLRRNYILKHVIQQKADRMRG